MIVPITRKEKLLNAIATNGNVDFLPKTREELFLFKILCADVNTPTPITRKELLYQHIIDGTIPTFEPRTRLEKFIMAAAGAELELPVVLTREEYWWAEISDSAYKTITGAIVHFISKRARAIKSLIANISYTQDLNGYDSPWPAGGGKNLIPDAENMGESWNKGQAASVSNGVATLEGTDSNYNASITTAKMPKSIFDGTTILTWSIYYKSSSACTITYTFAGFSQSPSQSGHTRTKYRAYDLSLPSTNGEWLRYTILSRTIAESDFRSGSGDVNSVGFQIYARSNVTIQIKQEQVEKSASATDFAPYSNICPISGWTGANIANISDSTMQLYFAGLLNGDYGFVDLGTLDWTYNNATSTPIFSIKVVDINAKPNSSDFICLGYTSKLRFWTEANNDKCIGSGNSNFNISNFAYNDAITFKSAMSGVYLIYKNQTPTAPTITPTQYNTLLSSFNVSGWLVPIFWQTAAGTVYSGTLDVTNGKLTVTHGQIASYAGESLPGRWISSMDVYSAGGTPTTGAQVVYELATPQTYQLTPTEVTTLLGDNTIWADTGDVSVTY